MIWISTGCAIGLASALTLFAPLVSAQIASPEPPSSERGASIAAEADYEVEEFGPNASVHVGWEWEL